MRVAAFVAFALVACEPSETLQAPVRPVLAATDGSGNSDGGETDSGADGGWDGGVDAGPTNIVVYPRVGSTEDSTAIPQGPGLLLMGGGTDVDQAFVWMQRTISGGAPGRVGDVVVLRASRANAYDAYLYGLADFNSAQTIRISSPAAAADLAAAAEYVKKAEAVFFAGGDQSDYVRWKQSPLSAAVEQVYARGGVVGGTSAGLAIMGQFVFDALAGSPITAEAVANPYHSSITFTRDLFAFVHLKNVITDSHFRERDRFGRLSAFMARQIADGATGGPVLGLGIDEATAVVVDKRGIASVVQQRAGSGAAYFIRGGAARRVAPGQPLAYPGLTVTRLDSPTQSFDLTRWCGNGPTYTVAVDGANSPPYAPADPYAAAASGGSCP